MRRFIIPTRFGYFYPRPPRGGRQAKLSTMFPLKIFLSTPSARRATKLPSTTRTTPRYFYPRPPRGGRPAFSRIASAHLDFYPRPPRGGRRSRLPSSNCIGCISIHALREEGDSALRFITIRSGIFLSTPSARRATTAFSRIASAHLDFYPRPPRGGRHKRRDPKNRLDGFLSTPSARRATTGKPVIINSGYNFYPRPPRGGRQQKQRENTLLLSHYTPLCTNCKEMLAKQTAKSHRYLRKRLVFRCEASRKTMCAAGSHWPDIKRSARCLGQILGAVQRARPSSGSCCPAGRTADCPRRGRSGRSALL